MIADNDATAKMQLLWWHGQTPLNQ